MWGLEGSPKSRHPWSHPQNSSVMGMTEGAACQGCQGGGGAEYCNREQWGKGSTVDLLSLQNIAARMMTAEVKEQAKNKERCVWGGGHILEKGLQGSAGCLS